MTDQKLTGLLYRWKAGDEIILSQDEIGFLLIHAAQDRMTSMNEPLVSPRIP